MNSTALSAQQLLDSFQQIALIELAFDDIGLRAGLQPAASMCLRSQAGDDNHRQFGQPQVGTNAAGQLEPINTRHLDIADHQIVGSGAEFVKRVEPIDGGCNIVAGRLKDACGSAHGW